MCPKNFASMQWYSARQGKNYFSMVSIYLKPEVRKTHFLKNKNKYFCWRMIEKAHHFGTILAALISLLFHSQKSLYSTQNQPTHTKPISVLSLYQLTSSIQMTSKLQGLLSDGTATAFEAASMNDI
jgi:hypothetical protein